MFRFSTIGRVMLGLSCLGLVLPPSAALAAGPRSGPTPRPRTLCVADAALGPGGLLRGKVVDHQGKGIPAAEVVLVQKGRPVAQTGTDRNGQFAIANLNRGVYELHSAGGVGVYRVWPAGIAPPSANREALLVAGGRLVRGQGGVYQWVSEHYLLTCTGIAAAIVVPIVVIDANRSPSSP